MIDNLLNTYRLSGLALGASIHLGDETLRCWRLVSIYKGKRGANTHVEVIGVLELIRIGKGLISSATVSDIVGAAKSVGEFMEGGPTTDIAGRDACARAEAASRNLIEKDAAVVNLYKIVGQMRINKNTFTYIGGGDNSVGNDTSAADIIGVDTAQANINHE